MIGYIRKPEIKHVGAAGPPKSRIVLSFVFRLTFFSLLSFSFLFEPRCVW